MMYMYPQSGNEDDPSGQHTVFLGNGIKAIPDTKISQNVIYSDRLLQWDYEKHNQLCLKHWGNKAQRWSGRSSESIQAFLRDWTNNPTLVLTRVDTGNNVSNGFPYWVFFYDYIEQPKADAE